MEDQYSGNMNSRVLGNIRRSKKSATVSRHLDFGLSDLFLAGEPLSEGTSIVRLIEIVADLGLLGSSRCSPGLTSNQRMHKCEDRGHWRRRMT